MAGFGVDASESAVNAGQSRRFLCGLFVEEESTAVLVLLKARFGEKKGDEVGEKLEGRRDGSQGEGVLLADKLKVVGLMMLLVCI